MKKCNGHCKCKEDDENIVEENECCDEKNDCDEGCEKLNDSDDKGSQCGKDCDSGCKKD